MNETLYVSNNGGQTGGEHEGNCNIRPFCRLRLSVQICETTEQFHWSESDQARFSHISLFLLLIISDWLLFLLANRTAQFSSNPKIQVGFELWKIHEMNQTSGL